jgi:hypothetical protein
MKQQKYNLIVPFYVQCCVQYGCHILNNNDNHFVCIEITQRKICSFIKYENGNRNEHVNIKMVDAPGQIN